MYHANGSFNYQDIQAMSLYEANFFFKRLYEEKQKERKRQEEIERANRNH
jgi:hypothetical protein